MKYIYLAILLMLTSCELFAQSHNYKAIWDYNPIGDQVIKYRVFIVELDDTLSTPFTGGMETDSLNQYLIGEPFEVDLKALNNDEAMFYFESDENGKWLQLGASAVNANGESALGVSAFFKKDFKLLPSQPNAKRIEY